MGSDVSTWKGVTCASNDGGITFEDPPRVLEISLVGAGVTGELPDEVGKLKSLVHLDLTDNKLSGVAAGVGQLTSLKKLVLRGNNIESLPTSLGGEAVYFPPTHLSLDSSFCFEPLNTNG